MVSRSLLSSLRALLDISDRAPLRCRAHTSKSKRTKREEKKERDTGRKKAIYHYGLTCC